jgi:hypothetical protein
VVVCSFLLTASATAQDDEAVSRWGKATGDALVHFLPDAAPWGLSPDPSPIFNAFANDTPHKYIALVVHQTWWFDDAELSRQMADVKKKSEALKQEEEETLKEFLRVHGAEMEALKKAHQAEMDTLTKQSADLVRQGKYEEAGPILQKLTPFRYAPYESLAESFDKRKQETVDSDRELSDCRRSVGFRIYTNRTPSTTAFAYPTKPMGTLAGHPFYRQDGGTMKMGGHRVESIVNLAVFLGPPRYQNPRTKLGQSELAVKCIVVWAWIESRPDAIQADEATARKVLESMDYEGLSKLIEP